MPPQEAPEKMLSFVSKLVSLWHVEASSHIAGDGVLSESNGKGDRGEGGDYHLQSPEAGNVLQHSDALHRLVLDWSQKTETDSLSPNLEARQHASLIWILLWVRSADR